MCNKKSECDFMTCPKCESKLPNSVKYCPRCGYLFTSNDVNTFSEIFNVKLLEIYYPNKSKRINTKFSLPYLLFSYFYAVYMKMYKCAFLSFFSLLLIPFILLMIERWTFLSLGSIFYPVLFLLCGCVLVYLYYVINFDRLLLENRKNKINSIIRLNRDKSFEEIKEIVIKDNQKNIKGLLLSIVFTIIFLFFVI